MPKKPEESPRARTRTKPATATATQISTRSTSATRRRRVTSGHHLEERQRRGSRHTGRTASKQRLEARAGARGRRATHGRVQWSWSDQSPDELPAADEADIGDEDDPERREHSEPLRGR